MVKNVIRILSVICLIGLIPATLISADTDTILPDGDGTINQWTASSGTDRYKMVNDGSTSTYIEHGAPFKRSSSGAYPYIENNGEIEILKRGEIC